MPRSIDQLIASADEMADQFEAYEPREDDRGIEPPSMALRRIAYRRALVEGELAEAVSDAKAQGLTWQEIGDAVGTSGEAARQKYRKNRTASGKRRTRRAVKTHHQAA